MARRTLRPPNALVERARSPNGGHLHTAPSVSASVSAREEDIDLPPDWLLSNIFRGGFAKGSGPDGWRIQPQADDPMGLGRWKAFEVLTLADLKERRIVK